MATNDDFEFAMLLQNELNELNEEDIHEIPLKSNEFDALNLTQNLVHPEWEVIDPIPDVFALFAAFDTKFFQGKLRCVELEWSKRMYSCAGICYQRRNGIGKSCTIRLSEPLLKLRSRKNLIETLLHEMIHAYLFTLNIREGNGGHGPNFKRIMTNINRTAGTNITVYHSFHDEVNHYKTHIWRCNGICQHRKPFFGYVRRTSNRAPGPNDLWWRQHSEMCGGYFGKIAQPEPQKRQLKTEQSIQKTPQNSNPKITHPIQKTSTFVRSAASSSSGNLSNVVRFKDLNSTSSSRPTTSIAIQSAGRGQILSQTGTKASATKQSNVMDTIRSKWVNKYPETSAKSATNTSETFELPSKKAKYDVQNAKSQWQTIDDDLEIKAEQPTLIVLDDSVTDITLDGPQVIKTEKRAKIDVMDSFDMENDSDIELIDDEYDEELAKTVDACLDKSVIDDLFADDTLMKDFNDINNVIMQDPLNVGKSNKEIITCPICQERMERELLNDHLDGCLGIKINISATSIPSGIPSISKSKPKQQRSNSQPKIRYVESSEEQEYNQRIIDEMEKDRTGTFVTDPIVIQDNMHPCPVCSKPIEENQINDHLDLCLLQNN